VLLVTGGIASAASRWVKWQQVAVWLLLIAGLASMALTTRRQTSVWRSDETLWRHVLDHAPSSLADNNLGQILLAQGEPGQALFHLVRSLEQSPAYPRPWRAVGKILELPPTPDAPPSAWVAAILERGLRHQPGLVSARYASALAMVRSGRIEHGRRELELVLRLDPQHSGARLALARLQRPSTGDASESRGGVGVGRQGEASEGRSSGL
jgi:tetratricopeptide (TPR) repeat protein